MAIDSALKRRSISGIPVLVPGVTPNATAPAAWRASSGLNYAGITYSPPATPAVFTGRMVWQRMYKTGSEWMSWRRCISQFRPHSEKKA